MVLQGQDKWRKHPLIFEAWRRPFPMLGVSAVLFTCFCIGESLWKGAQRRAPDQPVFRVIAGPDGTQIVQKRVIAHGHGHGHDHGHGHGHVAHTPAAHAAPVHVHAAAAAVTAAAAMGSAEYDRSQDIHGMSSQVMSLDEEEYDELLQAPLPAGTNMDPLGLSLTMMSEDEE